MNRRVPEGGWGWWVVVSAFLSYLIWNGDTKALTVLLPALREQYSGQTWLIGSMIGGLTTVMELAGPVVGAITENSNIDPRYIAMAGGALSSFGFIAASFSSSTWQLIFFISVFGGTGLGLSYIQSTTLVTHYFDELYPRVSGIITCGSPIAMFIFAPMTQLFLDTYGWRASLLLLGALNANLIFAGSLLRPLHSKPEHKHTNLKSCTVNSDQHQSNSVVLNKSFSHVFKLLFPVRLFTNIVFILHLIVFCCSAFVISGWFIYLIPHCISNGLSPYEAAAISMIAATVSIVGRIGYAPLVEKKIVQSRTLMYASGTVSALALLVDPWMDSFWSLAISSSVYFFGIGIMRSLLYVLIKDNVGAEHVTSGLGWCLAVGGIFRFLAGAIIGYIYDCTGSYDYGFLLLGGVAAVCVVFLAIEDVYQRHNNMKHYEGI